MKPGTHDLLLRVKNVLGCFLFLIDFFCIYIRCRKLYAEFNKLIKTIGHCACFFDK